MSGRRTWMPEESAAPSTDRAQTHQDADGYAGADRGAGAQSGAGDRQADQPAAGETPSGVTQTGSSRREWLPSGSDRRYNAGPEDAHAASHTAGAADDRATDSSVMDTSFRDAPGINRATAKEGAGSQRPQTSRSAQPAADAGTSRTTAADADTTDIPITPRTRSAEDGGDEEPAAAAGGGAASAGVWSAMRNRISGKGPLSAEREQHDAQQDGEKPEPEIEPGGSMDPNVRMKRLSSSIRSGDHEPATAVQEEEDEREGLTGSGPLLWFIDHWILITAPLVLVCVGIFVFATVFTTGSGEEIASSEGGSGDGGGKQARNAGGGEGQVPLYESGLVFDYTQKDGQATLTAGDLTWEGEVTQGGGDSPEETVTLVGPTAAKVNRGYEMDGGSEEPGKVETMTYAVEAEDAPDIHATYQRFSGHTANGPVDAPNGSYSVTADSGDLIAEGNYSDRRTGEGPDGNEVIRTYTETVPGEGEPEQFRVRYEAPEGAPIPALVGWQEPEDRGGADGGSG